MMRFQNPPLLKVLSKVSVFISIFARFSSDDRRRHIKMYAFSNENVLANVVETCKTAKKNGLIPILRTIFFLSVYRSLQITLLNFWTN